MAEIREIKLPGVGVRYEFTTADGTNLSVVTHRTGRREVFLSNAEDSDRSDLILSMTPEYARTLGELLGVSKIQEELTELQQRIEGLVIDWLPLREDSPFAGRAMGDAHLRSRTTRPEN